MKKTLLNGPRRFNTRSPDELAVPYCKALSKHAAEADPHTQCQTAPVRFMWFRISPVCPLA